MITTRKTKLLILAFFCVFATTYGQQDEKPKQQLWFELASRTIEISEDFSEIKYVGLLHIIDDRDLRPWIGAIQTTSKWKEMSEKQQQFILKLQNDYKYRSIAKKKRTGYSISTKSDYIYTPEGTRTYRVYAVSKEDVRKMAEAVIEWHNNNARIGVEFARKQLKQNQKIIAEAEKMIPKLEAEYKQLEAQAEEKTKQYIKDNNELDKAKENEIFVHAKKNMEELARYMKLAKFELIGLHARINSIERFKANRKISDPGTLIKLDQMLITDQIEEAGVLAQINAYEEAFKQAKKMYDVIDSYYSVEVQKRELQEKLEIAQKQKNNMERRLANPPAYMQPVKIHENKVVIWQVK